MKTERAPTSQPADADGQPSPLAVIRGLEDRMASRIDGARLAAAERVAEARAQAEHITAAERADAEDRAEAAYRTALTRVHAEADLIRSAAAERAARLLEEGERRRDEAASAVLAFVLPEGLDALDAPAFDGAPEASAGGDRGG